MNYAKYLNIALKAAKSSGKILKSGFNKVKVVKYKNFADPVTEYDKKAERIIVEIISKTFPDHSILTEEDLSKDNSSNKKWIIDPLDGTVNFIHGIPFFAVSIALEIDKEIVVGVIHNPVLNETFYAVKGSGAFFNNNRIYVSSNDSADEAFLVTGIPYKRQDRVDEILKPFPEIIKNFLGFRRLGSAAIDLAYLAAGKFDVFYEEGLNPWDTAAGILLVTEAGGKVTDYYNNEYSVYNKMILASNGAIHSKMLKLLSKVTQIK